MGLVWFFFFPRESQGGLGFSAKTYGDKVKVHSFLGVIAFPPAGCLFLLERVDQRCQKEGILGKKIASGRVGWTGQRRKKDAQKKVGI